MKPCSTGLEDLELNAIAEARKDEPVICASLDALRAGLFAVGFEGMGKIGCVDLRAVQEEAGGTAD